MSVLENRVCVGCDGPVVWVRHDEPGELCAKHICRCRGRWVHPGGDVGHKAVAKPQCPKCGSFDYGHYETNWGHGDRCGSCRYDFYFALGDGPRTAGPPPNDARPPPRRGVRASPHLA